MSNLQAAMSIQQERPKGTVEPPRSYGGYSEIVDYILGITYTIWEQGQVEAILDYYSEDIDVFSLESVTRGAAQMVDSTHATLRAFPDRLLLGDDVVWSGNMTRGFSSHRITSPMTNRGETMFGPTTGRQVRTMNIADCEITDGRISREWLLRDNLALVDQLGFDRMAAARSIAALSDDTLKGWLGQEYARVRQNQDETEVSIGQARPDPYAPFARQVLASCWAEGDTGQLHNLYAPYCVMHRAPVRIFSGREAVLQHFAAWRSAFPDATISLDHVCSQPFHHNGHHVAARWSLAGTHEGPASGLDATGRPAYLVGATHWRVLDGRIITEWTVFDELSLLAQLLDGAT